MIARGDIKEEVVSDIMIRLSTMIEPSMLGRVESIMASSLKDVTMTKEETALSTDIDATEELLKHFEMEYRRAGRSERTIEQYLNAFHAMLDYLMKGARDITTMDVRAYLDHYSIGNQASTYNNQRRFISAVFTWMVKHRFVEYNPCDLIPTMKEIKKPIDYLTDVEIDILRSTCKKLRDRALFEFLLSTGVRVGELLDIRIDQVSMIDGEILVYAPKTSDYRVVFLSDVARLHLKRYLNSRTDNEPYLFVSAIKPHKRLDKHGVEDILRRLGDRSELNRRVYPHLLRHTMATRMRLHGAQLEDIQQILGHKNPSVTIQYYAAVTKDHLKSVHRRCAA